MSNPAELIEMLSYRRPARSRTERAFIDRYVLDLPHVESDYCESANWHVQVGESPILWSCHTDTVHHDDGRQRVHLGRDGIVRLHRKERVSNCLGADDTAGVYILRQMILRGIPGHYVFHNAEERCCMGSRALAREHALWLQDFKFAIALDRQGKADIITHQSPGRTASDAFAWSLHDALALDYRPCDRGVYTDTAEYAHLISECTNLSVGYEACHSPMESLDTLHVDLLLEALCLLDQSALSASRMPGDFEMADYMDWLLEDQSLDAREPIIVDGDLTTADDYLDPAWWHVLRALRDTK